MRKKIWILNHYATNTFFDKGGRHYNFAKHLLKAGYDVRIFCASTVHGSQIQVDTKGEKWIDDVVDGVSYTFIKTCRYQGNKLKRIINMTQYYLRVMPVVMARSRKEGKPVVILSSSVHPLTLVAGTKLGAKLNIPNICEVRDLWPESLVAYGILSKNNPITMMLYALEKWIYMKANAIIFTMEGGKQYILDRGWESSIDLNKVNYINNGVDLEQYDYNQSKFQVDDSDLSSDMKRVIYAGSIRRVNNLEKLVEVAKVVKQRGLTNVNILIFGDGNQRLELEEKCQREGLGNVIRFKGAVEKGEIPFVLSTATVNVINCDNSIEDVSKYGLSPNKEFEYLASGKPIICTFSEGDYSIIEKSGAGIAKHFANPEEYCDEILKIINMQSNEYERMGINARRCSEEFDFKVLTENLIQIIEALIEKTV